jgi:hypothetical protein
MSITRSIGTSEHVVVRIARSDDDNITVIRFQEVRWDLKDIM